MQRKYAFTIENKYADVITAYFASISVPTSIAQWFGNSKGMEWLSTLNVALP